MNSEFVATNELSTTAIFIQKRSLVNSKGAESDQINRTAARFVENSALTVPPSNIKKERELDLLSTKE